MYFHQFTSQDFQQKTSKNQQEISDQAEAFRQQSTQVFYFLF